MKIINPHPHEDQWAPGKINLKTYNANHMIVNPQKTENFGSIKRKWFIMHKGSSIRLTVDLSETMQSRCTSNAERKRLSSNNSIPLKTIL